jgi:putative SOS response-associated peptidase YedK
MCGRIALYTPPARMARAFDAELAEGVDRHDQPTWNVGPTTLIDGIRLRRRPDEEERRVLGLYRWGLVPSWSKNPSEGSRLFNARAETIATKASFRTAFEKHRGLIPVDGFYEWRKVPGRGRQPHFFQRADGTPMAFAGLFAFWRDQGRTEDDPDAWIRSCTIVTTTAGPDMDGIHDRMPVVLDPEVFDVWLDPDGDGNELRGLLRPPPRGTLTHHRVDPKVGNVKHDTPDLVGEYAAPSGGSGTLF